MKEAKETKNMHQLSRAAINKHENNIT